MKISYFVILMLALAACKSPEKAEDSKLTKVKLMGYDMRMCACCGGQLLSFNLIAEKYQDTLYNISNIVKNDIISDTTTYPKFVNVEWKFVQTQCGLQKVDILRIEK